MEIRKGRGKSAEMIFDNLPAGTAFRFTDDASWSSRPLRLKTDEDGMVDLEDGTAYREVEPHEPVATVSGYFVEE